MFCGIKLQFLKLEILYSSFKSFYNSRREFITDFFTFCGILLYLVFPLSH
jgi:hypothetical protein